MESNGLLNTKSQKKSSLKQQAYKLEGNFEIIDRMMYPLKSLSVLGITECHISRKSLHSLEVIPLPYFIRSYHYSNFIAFA